MTDGRMTAEEVGRELNVTGASVRQWLRLGAFPRARLVLRGRAWRWEIPAADLHRFRAVNTIMPFADVRERLRVAGITRGTGAWPCVRRCDLLRAYDGEIRRGRMQLYLADVEPTFAGDYEIERLERYVFSGIGRLRVPVVIPEA